MDRQGKFIVIDGSDGAGKKTQADLLVAKLKSLGRQVAYYDFPQYSESFFGRMVGRYLNGEFGEADDVSPYLSSLLYAGDRFEASDNIKKDLLAGKIVISNRYIQSNMAFQSAKLKTPAEKKRFLTWLEELEYKKFNIPKADLVIYLYLPFLVSQGLVAKKEKRDYTNKTHDIHEKNTDFLSRVEKEYLKLAKNNLEWQKIDCSAKGGILSREIIAEKIFEKVKGIL